MALGSAGQHPAVLDVALRHALMQLPELEQQTSITRSAVQSIVLNPQDSNRLAFHLASGWSGEVACRFHALLALPVLPGKAMCLMLHAHSSKLSSFL